MQLAFLLFAMFASLFGLSKAALDYSEPFFLIGSRMSFAGLLLVGYQAIQNPKELKLASRQIIPLLALAFFAIYLTNVTEIWGVKHMISARACLIYSLSPFLAALFSYFLLGEVLSSKKWLGLSVGFVGLLPIILEDFFRDNVNDMGIQSVVSLADIAILVAASASVYGWILLKKLVSELNCSFLTANGISMVIGGGLALSHSYLAGEAWNPVPVSDMVPFLKYTLSMCLISNVICYNLYGYLLKRYSATFLAFAGLVTPLFASLFGWLFLDENVSPLFFVAFVLFSVGLTLFHAEEIATKAPEASQTT